MRIWPMLRSETVLVDGHDGKGVAGEGGFDEVVVVRIGGDLAGLGVATTMAARARTPTSSSSSPMVACSLR